MKTSNYISIIAIMAFILSSCGSLSISQKRYSKGLNIDWFAAKEDKGAAQKVSVRKSKKVDIHGKIVKTLLADQAKLEINTTELSSGIYTLKIGVRLIKFVVEK